MIDIGVNLVNNQFKNKQEQVIKRAKEAGLSHIICTGTSMANSKNVINLANKNKGFLSATAGVHPHNAKEVKEQDIITLKEWAKQDIVVAVGECGLDYDRNFSPRDVQKDIFRKHLDIAREVKKPLFLHEREAVEDFILIMKDYEDLISKSIVHCFTGNKDTLKKYLDLGFMIGITGWICDDRRGRDLQEAIKICPLDRLCIETDSPFLIPKNIQPKPNTRTNEPMYLNYVAQKIAECKGVSFEEVREKTTFNAKQFFCIN